jgi:imidazolonepropionase-like amidohydrolase
MIASIGGTNNSSRAKDLALIEDLLSLAKDAIDNNINSSEEINEFIEDSALANRLELLPRDIVALTKLVTKNIALIIDVHRASDILKIIELQRDFDLRVVISGGQESWMVADAIANARIPVILDPLNNIPNSFDQLGARNNTAKLLDDAGVLVMFKVDRSHNYHLIRQGAGNAVANGLAYHSAINGLSSNVADVFKIKDRGKIKKGFYADLIVWDGDPLEPASMPLYLFINGEMMDLTSRSTRLRDRYTNQNNIPNTYKD